MPYCGDNLLCIVVEHDVWVLEMEIIRVLGLEGSTDWKDDIPDYCRAKILVPRFDAEDEELSLISVTGLYYFIRTTNEIIEDNPHHYAKVKPEKN